MATATKRKPRKPAGDRPNPLITLPCEFSGVSLGEGTARLGVKINRQYLGSGNADCMLVGHRITGTIAVGSFDPKQLTLFEGAQYTIESTFDVKAVNLKVKTIGFGMTFSLADIDPEDLTHFAKAVGGLAIYQTVALEDCEDEEDEEEAEQAEDGDDSE